ncbi:MAG: TonB-dependent receptor plug domain-containing protein [Cyclobacteriaceae bacterium]|nr:TonB-dependent receptor plug domain-containing protein [Cyclobacteriaceae bacterium]
MKKSLIYLVTIIILFTFFFSFSKIDSFIDDLIRLVERKRETSLKETVFVHTDRNSYQPGDTLWLKGYVNEYTTGTKASISQTLYVDIVDKKGNKITSNEYYISNGSAEGIINLPYKLDDGEYNLVAYASMMKNHSEQWYFSKPIYFKNLEVTSQIIPNLNLKVTYDKENYYPGDNVVAKLSFIKNEKDKINKTTFEYSVKSSGEIIESFKTEAINFGDVHIRFKIPENEHQVSIEIKVNNRDQSLVHSSIVPLKTNNIIMSFFPEGGNIVRNLMNKVAFQATDSLGNAINIKGNIVDEKGNTIMKVETEFNGLGTFNFVPIKGESYFFSINNKLIPIPNILKEGIVMNVEKMTNDTLSIRLSTNKNKARQVYISATMRDKTYWALNGVLNKTALVKIPLNKMPKGILQITLFDENKLPQAERLCFINQDKKLNIEIVTNRKLYNRRDSVSIKIKVKDHLNNPVKASLSLAATDALFDQNNLNEFYSDIDTYFTLSSQLHGNWRKGLNHLPVWNNEKLNEAVELMLLTYGWRKFEWNKLHITDTIINYELIKGRVTKGKSKPYQNIPVNLMSLGSYQIFTTSTDSSGRFTFSKFDLQQQSSNLLVTSSPTDYSSRVRLSISSMDNNIPNFISTDNSTIKYQSKLYTPNTQLEVDNYAHYKLLQEVVIKEKEIIDDEDPLLKQFSNASSKRGEELTHSYNIVGLIRQVTPIYRDDKANSKVYFRSNNTLRNDNSTGALFVVDGVIMGNSYAYIPNITSENIDYLTIVKDVSGTFLYGSRAIDGIVFITSKYVPDNSDPKMSKNMILLKGYSKHRVFYSPQYITEESKNNPIPDLRKTIYWNPTITTDENGEAIVNYYNADRKTIVNITIQGMSNTGLFGSSKSSYTVFPKSK